jgi:hypothetical protein
VSYEFAVPGAEPFTLRFDVVSVRDTVYELRDGSGIGVLAPHFGPHRGYDFDGAGSLALINSKLEKRDQISTCNGAPRG